MPARRPAPALKPTNPEAAEPTGRSRLVQRADVPTYRPALGDRGHCPRIRDPHRYEHRVVKGPGTNVLLPVFSSGGEEIHRMLTVRAWLRAHIHGRRLYGQAKRELAARPWRNV